MAESDSMVFALSTKSFKDSSVIVLVNSVATTPGSMHVTRMFERVLNSWRNPSLNAVTACFVAQ